MENVIKKFTPVKLAYIGDAVYEVYIREYVLSKHSFPMKKINSVVVSFVNAKSQAIIVKNLELTDEEEVVVNKGKNIKSLPSSSSTTVMEYRLSSGFEALIGALYLSGKKERLDEILKRSVEIVESNG